MKLFHNSLLSLLPTIVGVFTSILTVPFYISLIGEERYGALLIGLVLLGYFGRVDFGLGRAVTQRLSYNTEATQEERSGIVASALVGGGFISILGAAVIFFAAHVFFGSFFEADAALKNEAVAASWLFALCIPVIIFTGVSSGALVGLERFGVVSIATVLGNFLSQVLPLVVAVTYSTDLSWLLAASLAGRLIGLAVTTVSMWRVFLERQPRTVSFEQLRALFNYGSWIMVTAVVGPLMIISDRLVIGAAVGAAAVVAYSVPFQIASRTAMLPGSVAQALFPRLASQTVEASLALGKISVVLVGQIYAFIVIGLICLTEPLLKLWLGDVLDPRSVLIGQIIIIGFWTNAIAYIPFTSIQASGNSKFTALVHVAELPVYLGMLFGLGMTLGLYGVALAFSIRTTLDCVVLFVKAGFVEARLIGRLLGPASLILIAFLAAPWMNDWLPGITVAAVLCTLLSVLCLFQTPEEVKVQLTDRWRAFRAPQ